jgi:GNAT superfamily N-acetyltransferase
MLTDIHWCSSGCAAEDARMDWVISTAVEQDAGEIMTVQRAAYVSEALLYDTTRLSALSEPIEEICASVAAGEVQVAKLGTRVVGAVRGVRGDGECRVGRLVVAPDMQGRGIGAALLRAVEERNTTGVRRFALFTGDRSAANIRLYRKAGYTETHREVVSETLSLVHLAKAAQR